jgi:hypothetical protein
MPWRPEACVAAPTGPPHPLPHAERSGGVFRPDGGKQLRNSFSREGGDGKSGMLLQIIFAPDDHRPAISGGTGSPSSRDRRPHPPGRSDPWSAQFPPLTPHPRTP